MFSQTETGNTSDSDEDLEQDDLNNMVRGRGEGGISNSSSYSIRKQANSSVTDPSTLNFLDRIQANPDQVLRYSRWKSSDKAGPLWFRQNDRIIDDGNGDTISSNPPRCQYCGAQRKYEFQLMPQMLHYLLKRQQHQLESGNNHRYNDEELERKWQQLLNSMQETDAFIEQMPPEHVPPRLVEAKEKANQQYQNAKFGSTADLEFDVICVYTCIRSCGVGDNIVDADLGAYREEFAWVQASSA